MTTHARLTGMTVGSIGPEEVANMFLMEPGTLEKLQTRHREELADVQRMLTDAEPQFLDHLLQILGEELSDIQDKAMTTYQAQCDVIRIVHQCTDHSAEDHIAHNRGRMEEKIKRLQLGMDYVEILRRYIQTTALLQKATQLSENVEEEGRRILSRIFGVRQKESDTEPENQD